MKLHASGEDYLETILVLQKKLGMVRSVDVARHMEVSKPSVCHAVASLRDGGFLTMDEDHFLHLTDVGREVAEKIYERHCFLLSSLSQRALTLKLRRPTPAGLNTLSAMSSFSRLKEAVEQEQKTKKNRMEAPEAILPRKTGKEKNRCRAGRNLCAPIINGFFPGTAAVFTYSYTRPPFLMPSTKE